MPDFDPKSIPVLDDVIESADSDKNDALISADATDVETESTENIPELFPAEAAGHVTEDLAIENIIIPGAESLQTATADDDTYDEKQGYEQARVEPVVIDYNTGEHIDETAFSTTDVDNQADSFEQLREPQTQTQPSPISLQSITDDIVEQLMPELEQQLRSMLKQALEEKLPEQLTRPETSSSTDN